MCQIFKTLDENQSFPAMEQSQHTLQRGVQQLYTTVTLHCTQHISQEDESKTSDYGS